MITGGGYKNLGACIVLGVSNWSGAYKRTELNRRNDIIFNSCNALVPGFRESTYLSEGMRRM